MLALLSCNGDDNNNPEPIQPKSKNPKELVGTWQFYSGNPVSIFSNYEESQILNQTLVFVANGNMNESIEHPNSNLQGESNSINGNWFVENNQLKLTDWQGNEIDRNCSYKIYADSSLTLTINGKASVFYKHDEIKKKYPDLIIGRWDNMRKDSGRTRITFNRDGKGSVQTTYIEGAFYGYGSFSWSYNNNIITTIHDNVASSIATREYLINYLNKKSISWTYKNNIVHYVREQ